MMDGGHRPRDGRLVDGAVHGGIRQFSHQPRGPILAIANAGPEQQVDDHTVIALRDAPGNEAWLVQQPRIDVGVGED